MWGWCVFLRFSTQIHHLKKEKAISVALCVGSVSKNISITRTLLGNQPEQQLDLNAELGDMERVHRWPSSARQQERKISDMNTSNRRSEELCIPTQNQEGQETDAPERERILNVFGEVSFTVCFVGLIG